MPKKHDPSVLICDLRKQCVICGESYRRKLVKNNRVDRCYLESLTQFEASQTCSKACAAILVGRINARRHAERNNTNARDNFIGAPRG